jgi:hypothetical protein
MNKPCYTFVSLVNTLTLAGGFLNVKTSNFSVFRNLSSVISKKAVINPKPLHRTAILE